MPGRRRVRVQEANRIAPDSARASAAASCAKLQRAVARKTLFHLRLNDDSDVALARRRSREAGSAAGLPTTQIEELATAVTEIARNAVVHAGQGELLIEVESDERRALIVTVRDQGPGIADVEQALRDGYSTGQGLGLGLPSARRLVDGLELRSELGAGTTVILEKWLPSATPSRE